jgi:sugar fermentation stimulation protein A
VAVSLAGARLFGDALPARFLERPNRFVVTCELACSGRRVAAHLPNPGRLRELLLPGAALDLVERTAEGGTRYSVAAVRPASGRPIVLDTQKTNAVARRLLEAERVPGLEDATVVAAEHRVGHSRFDFLLDRRGSPVLLEVKSCTLVGDRVAMFPDAVTARGARHVAELAHMARSGAATAVLFVVHSPDATIFSPDYHTDPAFTRTLLAARRDVRVAAVAVGWNDDLTLDGTARPCHIPWETIEREAADRGSYLVVLEVTGDDDATIDTGALGPVRYRPGHYVYVGSAMAALSKRLERHRRRRKRLHWHVDHLRDRARFVEGLAIRASDRLECALAAAVRAGADWTIPRFGATDCGCGGHLFGFASDPRARAWFQRLLLRYRLDRLAELAPPGAAPR